MGRIRIADGPTFRIFFLKNLSSGLSRYYVVKCEVLHCASYQFYHIRVVSFSFFSGWCLLHTVLLLRVIHDFLHNQVTCYSTCRLGLLLARFEAWSPLPPPSAGIRYSSSIPCAAHFTAAARLFRPLPLLECAQTSECVQTAFCSRSEIGQRARVLLD